MSLNMSADDMAEQLADNPEGLLDLLAGLAYALHKTPHWDRFSARFAAHDTGSIYDRAVPPFLDDLAASLRRDKGALT